MCIQVIQRLRELLRDREISTGKNYFREVLTALAQVDPNDVCGPLCFYICAAWLKYVPAEAGPVVERLNAAYSKSCPDSCKALGWIKGAQALLALHERRHKDAIALCTWIRENALAVAAETELLATTYFIEARIMKRCAKYTLSQELGLKACKLFEEAKLPRMAALTSITISWSIGQLGFRNEARDLRDRAYDSLKDSEDRIALGVIHFARARDYSRQDLEQDALREFDIAAKFLDESPANLRRVLMDSADIELRIANREQGEKNFVAARTWSDRAKKKLDHVNFLIDPNKPTDQRDRVRFLLAKTNEALRSIYRNAHKARQSSKEAHKSALALRDPLMIARALYKSARIKQIEVETADDPWRVLQVAIQLALEALDFAQQLDNARLTARIHILLGELYLEAPFQDIEEAGEHWEAAMKLMEPREDLDFLVRGVARLQTKLERAQLAPPVIYVTASMAFLQPLEQTMREVEATIVQFVRGHLGNVPHAVATVLGVGHGRVERETFPIQARVLDRNDIVIYRVRLRTILTLGLEKTLQEVERAIRKAAERNFGPDQVRPLLRIGHSRSTKLADSDTGVL